MFELERTVWKMLDEPENWTWDEHHATYTPSKTVFWISNSWFFFDIESVGGDKMKANIDFVLRFPLWRKFRAMQRAKTFKRMLTARLLDETPLTARLLDETPKETIDVIAPDSWARYVAQKQATQASQLRAKIFALDKELNEAPE